MSIGHAGNNEETKWNRRYTLGNAEGGQDGALAAEPVSKALSIREKESRLSQAVTAGL